MNVGRPSVHIVIKDGMVFDAFSDTEVDVIVYDLDTEDPDLRAEVQRTVDALMRNTQQIEIL